MKMTTSLVSSPTDIYESWLLVYILVGPLICIQGISALLCVQAVRLIA